MFQLRQQLLLCTDSQLWAVTIKNKDKKERTRAVAFNIHEGRVNLAWVGNANNSCDSSERQRGGGEERTTAFTLSFLPKNISQQSLE
jgi:hypothetical protein